MLTLDDWVVRAKKQQDIIFDLLWNIDYRLPVYFNKLIHDEGCKGISANGYDEAQCTCEGPVRK